MSTTLAMPDNRIGIDLAGRHYPFSVKPELALPEGLEDLPSQLLVGMPLHGGLGKPDLFKGYVACVERFRRHKDRANLLFKKVATAGGFSGAVEMEFADPPAAKSELYALEKPMVLQAMTTVMKQSAVRFALGLVAALDEMVCKQHVGAITKTCEGACRYHYFSYAEEEEVLKSGQTVEESTREWHTGRIGEKYRHREHTKATTTVREKERACFVTRHVHDVIEAVWHGYEDKIERPVRVDPVYEAVPHFLRGLVRVVDGQQIRELRIKREISREQWTETETAVEIVEEPVFRYDPAIVVGHYVLAGWTGEEVERDAKVMAERKRLRDEAEARRKQQAKADADAAERRKEAEKQRAEQERQRQAEWERQRREEAERHRLEKEKEAEALQQEVARKAAARANPCQKCGGSGTTCKFSDCKSHPCRACNGDGRQRHWFFG